MALKPYYTSNTLIDAVKRKISFPIAQVTFSNEDILRFSDEEMFLAQVPSILQYHEEYLVYTQDVPLVSNQSRYAIPNRAIGMKLRDLFYRDTGGQLCEMSRINPDDRSFFEVTNSVAPSPIYYYTQNNSIILVPQVDSNATGTLVFSYYLRPNSLVTDENAAVCTSFSKTVTVDNTFLIAGDVLTIQSTNIIADTDFSIGVNSSTTANNLANFINSLGIVTTDVSGNIITISYSNRNMYVGSPSAGLAVQSTITVETTAVPSDILEGSLIDILQTDGGHSTLAFDVLLGSNSVAPTSITLTESQLPDDFVVGDYFCSQYECIVPQVPTDLHNLLAERTCARILEALGDKDGLQAANMKINELEQRQSTIIDSRVEGSPQKILNRGGLLRSNRASWGRRR